MKYLIDKRINKPIYMQLYEQIRTDISNKAILFGEKLPSKRLVSEELGISVISVEHAYSLLLDEGYIDSIQRSGYYVCFNDSDGFQHPATGMISMHKQNQTIEKSIFPFSVYAKTMRRVISEYAEEILEKSPNAGCAEFRSAIKAYLKRSRGIEVDENRIIIGSGAEYLYGIIIQMLGRERVYATEKPSYEKIEAVYRANGLKYELLELGVDGINSAALKASKASVLHITPYRSFPSGITASASKRQEYLRWAIGDRFIIEEDFESEFSVLSKPEETLFSKGKNDNVIYLNTFSKTISPAVRIGYMVLPEKLVSVFAETVGFYSCSVPVFEQLVLADFISSGNFERHINRVRRQKRQKQKCAF
ncbi:MAG: PLP-dependent aminotransferase family protein [Clostridia bacterium]|nr:PLP-dependent aminotransferase family protein [Clostridia bacterium]